VIGLFGLSEPPGKWYKDEFGNVLRNALPSLKHPLGTDSYGYDYLILTIYGWKTSFLAAFSGALFFLIFGIIFGIAIGYYGGKFSQIFQSIFNIINSFPILLLILLLIVIINAYLNNAVSYFGRFLRDIKIYVYLAIYGFLCSPKLAEIIKNQINYLKSQEFIKSAQCLGLSDFKIIVSHILWYGSRTILIAQLAYILAEGIMIEVTLSYLGYGISGSSWGNLLGRLQSEYLNATEAFYVMLLFIGGTSFYFYYIAERINRKYVIKKTFV